MSETTESPGTFTHVKGELAWTIAEHRSPSEAVAMARHLTNADRDRFELLGLTDDCETALYWDYMWNRVVHVEFDADGVYNLMQEFPDEIPYSGRGEYLDEADLDSWTWVHPRHKWRAE
ncbi:hypothetical protein [Halobaculum sp. EA56]|uniref:hypothetical protein n=1 Tax=Halobaculum sp. EA56 TaxID=3421648 RepID=UPI003EBC5128